jgi:hypothetical protein
MTVIFLKKCYANKYKITFPVLKANLLADKIVQVQTGTSDRLRIVYFFNLRCEASVHEEAAVEGVAVPAVLMNGTRHL